MIPSAPHLLSDFCVNHFKELHSTVSQGRVLTPSPHAFLGPQNSPALFNIEMLSLCPVPSPEATVRCFPHWQAVVWEQCPACPHHMHLHSCPPVSQSSRLGSSFPFLLNWNIVLGKRKTPVPMCPSRQVGKGRQEEQMPRPSDSPRGP